MTKSRKRGEEPYGEFKRQLVEAGGEFLAPTNPYEVMRFRTKHGVGVVYQNLKGKETWNREALAARLHLDARSGSLAPVQIGGRKSNAGTHQTLLARDGEDCFFCLKPLGDDITIEHLVAVAHGGPNHICNKFLAHRLCNSDAGHLSAPEKIRIRESNLLTLKGAIY